MLTTNLDTLLKLYEVAPIKYISLYGNKSPKQVMAEQQAKQNKLLDSFYVKGV